MLLVVHLLCKSLVDRALFEQFFDLFLFCLFKGDFGILLGVRVLESLLGLPEFFLSVFELLLGFHVLILGFGLSEADFSFGCLAVGSLFKFDSILGYSFDVLKEFILWVDFLSKLSGFF